MWRDTWLNIKGFPKADCSQGTRALKCLTGARAILRSQWMFKPLHGVNKSCFLQ